MKLIKLTYSVFIGLQLLSFCVVGQKLVRSRISYQAISPSVSQNQILQSKVPSITIQQNDHINFSQKNLIKVYPNPTNSYFMVINNAQPTVSIQPFGLGVGLNVTNANVNNNNFSLVQYTQNSIGPTIASDHTNTASTNPSHVFRSSGRNDVFRISTNANSQLDPGASLLTVQNNVMRNFINTAYFFNASDNSNGVYTVNTATNNSWAGTFINSNPLSTNTTKGLLVGNFGYGDGLYAQSRFGHAAVFMAPGSLESAVEIHGSQGSGANIPLALDVYGATSISGALFVSNGTKSAIINVNGQERAIFCEESPEVWVNDIGVFQLTNGEATVTLSSNFTQIANTNVPYVVFLQLEGDCNSAIKVASKTSTSFRAVAVDSMERINCNCDVAFRISAKRKGFENLNLPTKQEAIIASNNYLQTYGQSVLTYMNNKVNDMNLLNNNFSNFMSQRNNFPFNQNYTTSTFAQPNLPDPIDTVPEEGLLENKLIVPVETNN